MAEGKLPNFARLTQNGASGQLFSTIPITAPSWSSIYTGKNSGKHGIYSPLYQRNGSYDVGIIHSGLRRARDMWEIAGEKGVKACVVNAPATYPPRPLNGDLVVGHYAPESASNFCYPPELKDKVEKVVGKFQVYPGQKYTASGKLAEFRDAMLRTLKLTEYLLDDIDWRLAFVVFREIDEAQHVFIGDPKMLETIYGWMDTYLGRLLEKMDGNTFVVVVSDHGAIEIRSRIDTVTPLIMNGWLSVKTAGTSTRLKLFRGFISAGAKLRLTPLVEFPAFQLVAKFAKKKVVGLHVSTARSVSNLVNWERTKAYPYLTMGYRVNLQGREPRGIVPPEEYEELREKLVQLLLAMKDEKTGSPVFKFVARREDVFKGPYLEDAPDVYGLFNDGYWPYVWRSSVETLMTPTLTWRGAHASTGIFMLGGPGVKSGLKAEGLTVTDIAPTVLYLLGVPVPSDMDGNIRSDCLSQEIVEALPLVRSEASESKEVAGGLSKDEELAVEDNLRKLGYLD